MPEVLIPRAVAGQRKMDYKLKYVIKEKLFVCLFVFLALQPIVVVFSTAP